MHQPLDEGSLGDHERRNRTLWDQRAPDYVADGRRQWAAAEMRWGIWDVPEDELRTLPPLDGLDVVELGCGTAYWSAWFARRGARPVGIDLSERQLATARELQSEHGLDFPLLHASAEDVPLPDGGFDLAFSEYGASIWCEPRAWLAEAHRLLRPGGHLVFLCNAPLALLCAPPGEGVAGRELRRAQFGGLGRMEWEDTDEVGFCLGHGELLATLRATGFDVRALHELRCPPGGDRAEERYFLTRGWAQDWPSEDVWVAVKRSL